MEYLFLDVIELPAVLRHIPDCRASQHLFIACPISKMVDSIPLDDFTAESLIECFSAWRGRMIKKGFATTIFICTDAGTNFTSTLTYLFRNEAR